MEFRGLEEDSTAIRTIAILQVEAGRVRFGDKPSTISNGAKSSLQKFEVIHLLQADDVGIILDYLLK